MMLRDFTIFWTSIMLFFFRSSDYFKLDNKVWKMKIIIIQIIKLENKVLKMKI